jgi:hypothetical protein
MTRTQLHAASATISGGCRRTGTSKPRSLATRTECFTAPILASLVMGRPVSKSLNLACSRGFPQAFQPRAQHLPKRSKQDRNRPFSGSQNVMVGRARLELAVSWSQTGPSAHRMRLDLSSTYSKARKSLNSLVGRAPPLTSSHRDRRAAATERPTGSTFATTYGTSLPAHPSAAIHGRRECPSTMKNPA